MFRPRLSACRLQTLFQTLFHRITAQVRMRFIKTQVDRPLIPLVQDAMYRQLPDHTTQPKCINDG